LAFESNCKVSILGKAAFQNCSSLQSISIPSSIETISQSCFGGCRKLSSFKFETGSRISTIKRSAFSDCSSLTSISIPASIHTISGFCFSNCPNLRLIELGGGCRLDDQQIAELRTVCPVLSLPAPGIQPFGVRPWS
jgi:hypothetical protein